MLHVSVFFFFFNHKAGLNMKNNSRDKTANVAVTLSKTQNEILQLFNLLFAFITVS